MGPRVWPLVAINLVFPSVWICVVYLLMLELDLIRPLLSGCAPGALLDRPGRREAVRGWHEQKRGSFQRPASLTEV
jgi:hypothetical protein